MSSPQVDSIISKDFIKSALEHEGKTSNSSEIVSYSVKVGTKPGDNYISLIYTIEVELKNKDGKEEKRDLLLKCYPNHPQRQELNNNANMFFKELEIYSKWMPELRRFQTEDLGLERNQVVPLPYAHFVHGQCIDFESDEGKSKSGKVLHSLENYILMEDMRKKGFVMPNRRESLDIDHMRLVIKALATVHSLSWAYRHHIEKDLVGKFPCLKTCFEDAIKIWNEVAQANLDLTKKIFNKKFGTPDNEFSKAAEKFKGMKETVSDFFLGNVDGSVLEKYFRKQPPSPSEKFGKDSENPEPWRIICHGDCWSANLLFRYDPKTSKPLEVILLDLQIVHETCVVNDLHYCIYTCTDGTLRKNHLQELLLLYHDKFNEICAKLRTPTLPGFTLESLKYRFHRSKFFGFYMATIGLPIMLKEDEKMIDFENVDATVDISETFANLGKDDGNNQVLNERLAQVMQDMIEDGIL